MDTDAPTFTIIIPVIRSRYLVQAVDSVLEQSFGDFELIVIDDCSPDPVGQVLGARRDDPRVHYVRNAVNQGGSSPALVWNQGLALARGRYTMVLGDDDYYALNVLEELNRLAGRFPHARVLRTRLCMVDASGETLHSGDELPLHETWWQALYARTHHRMQSICEHAFDTAALRAMEGFPQFPKAWGSDVATVIALAVDGGCVSTNDAWSYWRNDGRNISSNDFPEFGRALTELAERMVGLIETHDVSDPALRDELLRDLRASIDEARAHYGSPLAMGKLRLKNRLKCVLDRLGLLDAVRNR
jgi:glycosyltransferase involved in cell wall biosynthesis